MTDIQRGSLLNSPAIQREQAAGKEEQANAPMSDAKTAPATRKKKTGKQRDDGQIGRALKSVYQHAVEEDIPLEMLDLLKKLD